jgi:hypothetical protein
LELSQEAAKKLLDEEEERRKARRSRKGRIRELEEVSPDKNCDTMAPRRCIINVRNVTLIVSPQI